MRNMIFKNFMEQIYVHPTSLCISCRHCNRPLALYFTRFTPVTFGGHWAGPLSPLWHHYWTYNQFYIFYPRINSNCPCNWHFTQCFTLHCNCINYIFWPNHDFSPIRTMVFCALEWYCKSRPNS